MVTVIPCPRHGAWAGVHMHHAPHGVTVTTYARLRMRAVKEKVPDGKPSGTSHSRAWGGYSQATPSWSRSSCERYPG